MYTIDKTEFIPYYKIPRILEAIIAIVLLVTWAYRAAENIKYKDQNDLNNHKAETYIIFIINGAFTIIFIIDIISQISGDPMDYTPMFLFLVTAFVLYTGCTLYMICLIIFKIVDVGALIIVHIVLSLVMATICLTDCFSLIKRKCGYV
nr:uncharacterized protein LOC106681717 [Halyomorpha halys]